MQRVRKLSYSRCLSACLVLLVPHCFVCVGISVAFNLCFAFRRSARFLWFILLVWPACASSARDRPSASDCFTVASSLDRPAQGPRATLSHFTSPQIFLAWFSTARVQ